MRSTLPDWRDMPEADRKQMVVALIAEKKSASLIARHFSNCTRNSVIGYCGRNNIPMARRPGPVRPQKVGVERQRPAMAAKTKPNGKGQPKAPAIAASVLAKKSLPPVLPYDVEDNLDAVDVTHLIGILDLKAHHCRYIHGDPKAAHGYCGAQVKPSSSYCPEHHARVYPGQRP